MFSYRFRSGPEGHNPLWEARLAREASGSPLLDLTVSNPTVAGLAYPESIPALLGRPEARIYAPSPQGDPAARGAIAAYYAARGRTVRAEDLILTASTSEAYAFLFKLLCDPGDEVLIPSPTYPLFDALAGLEHVGLVRYPLRYLRDPAQGPRWRPDFAFLRSLISTRCKALILVNPNNPTGHLADPEEIRAYLEFASEYGLALIVDEVFRDYLLGDRSFSAIAPLASDGPLVFTLNGFSKTLGLPQLKLGWIHVAGASDAARAALGHLEWIADAFLSVNAPVQAAARDLLSLAPPIQGAILSRLRANLAAAEAMLAGAAERRRALGPGHSALVRLLRPEAGWSLVLEADIPGAGDDAAYAVGLVRRHGVYVHPGHLFGFEGGCRLVISLLGPEADFRRGLEGILAHAAEVSDG